MALALGGQPQQPQTHERVDEIKASLNPGPHRNVPLARNDLQTRPVSSTRDRGLSQLLAVRMQTARPISFGCQSAPALDGWVGSSIIRALATSTDSSLALSARLSAKRDASLRGWEISQRG